MNSPAVVRILSMLGLFQAAGLALTCTVALAYGEWRQLMALALALLFVSVTAASLLLLTPAPKRRSRARDGLALVILWWLLTSISGALPFMFDAPAGMVLLVWHEAVSCLTTTGHSVLPVTPDSWPVSLVAWRGFLHLSGAMASLVTAASVFAAINIGGPGIHRTVLFTDPKDSFFDALPRVIRAAALALGLLIAVMTGFLTVSGVSFGVALGDAVSVATTGLVAPGRAGIQPESALHSLFLFVGLVVSTIGLAIALEIRAARWRRILRDPETVSLAVILLAVIGVLMISGIRFDNSFGLAISLQSTAGLPLFPPDLVYRAPLPVLLLAPMVGGAALSTAGGIKLARLALLGARAGEEFSRLGFRDSVVVMRYRDRVQKDSAVIGVWVYLVAYFIALFAIMLALSMLAMSFEDVIVTSVGLLSNTGSLVWLPAPAQGGAGAAVSCFAMLLGRLEVIALVPAFSPGFWRG
jgi:trk system potassium uptake protein